MTASARMCPTVISNVSERFALARYLAVFEAIAPN